MPAPGRVPVLTIGGGVDAKPERGRSKRRAALERPDGRDCVDVRQTSDRSRTAASAACSRPSAPGIQSPPMGPAGQSLGRSAFQAGSAPFDWLPQALDEASVHRRFAPRLHPVMLQRGEHRQPVLVSLAQRAFHSAARHVDHRRFRAAIPDARVVVVAGRDVQQQGVVFWMLASAASVFTWVIVRSPE